MKLPYLILIFIPILLWIAGTKLTLKPFHLSFSKPWDAIGCICLVLGIVCYQYGAYKTGQREMLDKVIEMVDKIKEEKE